MSLPYNTIKKTLAQFPKKGLKRILKVHKFSFDGSICEKGKYG